LQQCFEYGTKSSAKGDFEAAEDMFVSCIIGDPGNFLYAKEFLATEYRKYNNNKKGSRMAAFSGVGQKGSIKKASMQKDWAGVIKAGLELLKLNPWDVNTLLAMGHACGEMGCDEVQMLYLRSALDVNPKDAEVNRLCARVLGGQGQFDQAIACWHRVQQAKPGDIEAQREIGNLTVERTISAGRYEEAESTNQLKADRHHDDDRNVKLTPEQQLEKAIGKDPSNISNYLELADLHTRNDRFSEAEDVLGKALQASGGDVMVRERLEDAQVRRGRHQLAIAEQRAKNEKTQEALDLYKRMKAEFNNVELGVFRSRADRYPANLGLKFELGVRLKRAGQYKEAIEALQVARGEAKRKAAVHLELGECFEYIKQPKLALPNYEAAIEAGSDRDAEQHKLAHYRAGVLAYRMRDLEGPYLEKAEKYLTALAGLDYGYKDVAERLDKLAEIRNKG